MASAAQSLEQRELTLVGKVEMRIALADGDGKLESTLKTYLAPLLLKLASEHASVRNKVISICQHVNTRIKPRSIQLPVATLIKQFKEQQSPLIRHFDLLYVQQGVDRLSASEKAELLPVIISGFATSDSHGPQIFSLLLRLLEFFTLPLRGSKEDTEMRTKFDVSDADASFMAEWFGKLMLYTPQKNNVRTCPGLTTEDCAFLNLQGKGETWDPALGGLNLLRTKVLAARLLASGLFNDSDRFLPALFASADAASTISDIGDDMMKRTMTAIDLEDELVLNRLFVLYLGKDGAPRVSPPLRVKILGLLTRSTKSTSFANNIMSLVEDGVAPPDSDGEDVTMSNGITARAGIGRQATKLRTAVFVYINFVSRYGPADVLHAIAPRVAGRLRDFIENQGWPKPGGNEDLSSRGYAYEVIGLLAKAGPKNLLFEDQHPTLELLRWLLSSLANDSSGSAVVFSIEKALSTILNAVARIEMTELELKALENLLDEQMILSSDLNSHQRLRSCRYVTIRFANRCLPYSSIKARWVDILGIGAQGERMEVKEEGERGLSPYWYRMLRGSTGPSTDEAIEFPGFAAVVMQFFAGHALDEERESLAIVRHAREQYPHCFSHMVAFAFRTLYQEALGDTGLSPQLGTDWERTLDAAAENDPKAREAVKLYLEKAETTSARPLEILQSALLEQIVAQPQLEGDRLVQHISLAPDTLLTKLVPSTGRLLPVVLSNHHKARVAAGHAYGILASHSKASDVEVLNTELINKMRTWRTAVGAQANQVHGSCVALGFYYSRRHYRGLLQPGDEAYVEYVGILQEMLRSASDGLLKEAAFVAIGQLSMFRGIELEPEQLKQTADKIFEVAKTGNERAILCLGQLSMICANDTAPDAGLMYFEKRLHELHEVRQAEVHFSVGEALSYVACGWKSDALSTKLDMDGPRPSGPERKGVLERLTGRIIADCANTKPALKKAAVMWLLCLVQYCGQLPELQERLGKCQLAFKRCLGDRDELVQETASRGLGLVYEKGDRSLKDDLVRDLVSSFSSDKQSQLSGNVSADTQLFEPGALPTGDGSVSTYKDILSLASEVGDSSLVYRFMSMASSNAIWSTRAAFGRFGLSNVLSDSSVDGYLANNPKLYPKLFRYRFDPNPGVQRSMTDIWNALVKDSTATIDKHFVAIIEDLLRSILGKEWRVRQASCAAIADLVQGRPLEKYESFLEQIWNSCFKVLDDIKESVRAAAASLARTLTGILTRALEADHSSTKTAAGMLKHVLPFLLSPSGMESSAKEVQGFAVHTLLEIIKKSNGTTLRPFIPDLVERLVALLSSLEPEAVNYIHLNASKYNLTEQKIDDMRLSSVRSSPITEAIERCLDLLDDETMARLQPRLVNAMKSAVGLPSKVGSSRVLVSLSTRRSGVFKPFADDSLKLIEKLVLDRNETVASSYAIAAGYVARHASDKQILRLASFASELYFNAEGDREGVTPRKSIASGELMYALSKHASDRFNALAASFLPFVFVAKHDPHETVKEQFQNTWNDAVGGNRAVLLYQTEILELASKHLDSPQWTLKHTAARSVADVVDAVAGAEKEISVGSATLLWPAIEKALGGKTWEGKEVVLNAFVRFVECAKQFYQDRSTVASTIVKIAVKEAKRNNAAYQRHSVKALGQVAAVRRDVDLTDAVREVVQRLVDEMLQGDGMEVDGDERQSTKSSEIRDDVLAGGVEALFASIDAHASPSNLNHALGGALAEVGKIKHAAAPIRRATYRGVKRLFEQVGRARAGGAIDAGALSGPLRQVLFGPDAGSEAVRLLRAEAVKAVAEASSALADGMAADVQALLREERSANVRDRLTAAAAALGPAAASRR